MRELLKKLIHDEHGMIVSSEVVLVGTILVIGCVVGLTSVSHAVNSELNDVAQACDPSHPGSHRNLTEHNYSRASSRTQLELVGNGG